MRRFLFLPLFAAFSLALMACEEPPSEESVEPSAAETEGFYYQSHWPAYLARHTEDSPFSPERSDWERVEALEQSDRLAPEDLCGDSLGAVQAWAQSRDLIGPLQDEDLDVDIRYRELEDGGVEGLLQRWGFKDDAVAGVDHRVQFARTDNDCLVIERVEARHYCRRGIEKGARCL